MSGASLTSLLIDLLKLMELVIGSNWANGPLRLIVEMISWAQALEHQAGWETAEMPRLARRLENGS